MEISHALRGKNGNLDAEWSGSRGIEPSYDSLKEHQQEVINRLQYKSLDTTFRKLNMDEKKKRKDSTNWGGGRVY